MTFAQIVQMLQNLGPAIEPILMGLEQQGQAELKQIIAGVNSPDLKLLLQSLDGALDAFAQAEIKKLG